MKTFKGRDRGWFYVDELCRDMEKKNLDSKGCGRGGGPVELWSDQSGGEIQRQKPGTKEKGWMAECMLGRELRHSRKMEANTGG